MSHPDVSILIPNYNNGRRSSKSKDRDFLADLLGSLHLTLVDDPTAVEVIIADDGSTDDSLETARRWTGRTWGGWRGEQPVCRLIERPHCGVLSRVANRLTSEARGDICCRLDGDIVVLTERWAEELMRIFASGPADLGIVGPKQLGMDGRIHSMGSWILHPRGHHHVAQGAAPEAVSRAVEVDHVMGCFYCHRREIWERLGGYDESILRGQTVDFGLRARQRGWRTIGVPTIEFIHAHAERTPRPNDADSPRGVADALRAFSTKWGFDRLAPDLDRVAERYAGTGLLWNARVFGPSTTWPPPSPEPLDINRTEWGAYAREPRFQQALAQRVELVEHFGRQPGDGPAAGGRVLHVRSRGGLLCHLLAMRGHACTGVDPDPHHVDVARSVADSETYPLQPPRFVHQANPRVLPLEDGSVDAVLLFDCLETHPNPVGLLSEAHRVLTPQGAVAIVTRRRESLSDGDHDAMHAYRPHELALRSPAQPRSSVTGSTTTRRPAPRCVRRRRSKRRRRPSRPSDASNRTPDAYSTQVPVASSSCSRRWSSMRRISSASKCRSSALRSPPTGRPTSANHVGTNRSTSQLRCCTDCRASAVGRDVSSFRERRSPASSRHTAVSGLNSPSASCSAR
jgi:GT2 family glycosyltransferase/SAM-dependent methyltransferase